MLSFDHQPFLCYDATVMNGLSSSGITRKESGRLDRGTFRAARWTGRPARCARAELTRARRWCLRGNEVLRMKKVFRAALLCAAALWLLCAGAVAATAGDWWVALNGSSATITYYTGSDAVIMIPRTVTVNGRDYTVTEIGDSVFFNRTGLTGVTIPDSVIRIGDNAFFGCSRLTSVTIPNSVTSIGNSTFADCTELTRITIPNSVTSIGNSTFFDCFSLTDVTIPNSVTSIGQSVFYGCSSLTSVTIPNSVTSIGEYAFSGCVALSDIYFDGPETLWNTITKGTDWNADAPGNQTIHFNRDYYLLTFDANDGSGAMAPLLVPADNPQCTVPVCTFTPPAGMALSGWEIGNDETGWITYNVTRPDLTLSHDVTARALWAYSNVKTAVLPAGAATVVYDMYEGTFTAYPKDGYEFLGWQFEDTLGMSQPGYVSNDPIYQPAAVNGGTYIACLEPIVYAITVKAGAGGTASASEAEAIVGTSITLTATPDSGNRLREWQVSPETVIIMENRFVMPASDVTVTAVFEPIPVFGPASFTLPGGPVAIGANAFEGDTAITVVDAHTCTSIGAYAFMGCTGLQQIRLPGNCRIDPSAFTGCGTVQIFAEAGGTAETDCAAIENCEFVAE